jgi:hypothetical protein
VSSKLRRLLELADSFVSSFVQADKATRSRV